MVCETNTLVLQELDGGVLILVLMEYGLRVDRQSPTEESPTEES